jgi:hypothetical protein
MVTPERRLAEFKRDGFTIFDNAHPPDLLEQWREVYDSRCASEGGAVWLQGTFEAHPALFLPAIANPSILDFAEIVMGPFVQLDALAINAFPSVDPEAAIGKVNAWHRDRYSTVPQTIDYIHPLSCNTIFYFQDLTEEYGPLRVVPGSHRQALLVTPDDRERPRADEVLLYPKAGDVVFTHCNILHSGTPNTSGKLRYFMSASYNCSFMKHRDPLDGPNTRDIVERARRSGDRRLMRLLGEDEQLWDRVNPYWFMGTDEERWRHWISEDRAAHGRGENPLGTDLVSVKRSMRAVTA